MKRIVYCSRAAYDVSADELVALLQSARRHNAAAGVSGMLLYSCQSFVQVLDGDAAALDATFDRIVRDAMHSRIRVLLEGDVAAPLFPDWTMGFEHVDDETLARELAGFIPAVEYPVVNPDLITNAGVALTLLTLYSKNATR
jgi:hypothetical protein